MKNAAVTAAIAYIEDLFGGNAGGHDAEHNLRVYRNALRIMESESGCDAEIVALAALRADGWEIKKLYPEGSAEARFRIGGTREVYAYCNRHGLFKVNVELPREAKSEKRRTR